MYIKPTIVEVNTEELEDNSIIPTCTCPTGKSTHS